MSGTRPEPAGSCCFLGPVGAAGSQRCDTPAEERTVIDQAGTQVQVALCDDHYAYVSDTSHAHYWFVDRAGDGRRALIRMVRQHG